MLADLHPRKRREHVSLALEGVLRTLNAPASTADVVTKVATFLGVPREKHLVARTLIELAPTHANAEQVGEPFERFGRLMRRWQWTPLAKKARPKGESPEAVERRRAAQAAAEADDEWTIRPDEGFLEDDT